ncbi:ion channel [Oceanobacillus senegalensis]|uniref:ion channel n=1 Tax=Oceanobacillus senegalensis TaxID=1936063 RepID=UPI000A305BD0|nr:ion channel [Oceanobacillus senegalensis]
MFLIPWVIFVLICFVIFMSLLEFIKVKILNVNLEVGGTRFSTELFIALWIIFIIVILGFGLIYFILSFQGIILVENGELRQVSVLGSIIHSIYFSGVTLLTIGYGDITPIGIGRFIAVTEALIGYILPTAFVMKLIQTKEKSREK